MPGETRSTYHPLIGAFRHSTLTVKVLACAVILAFGGLVTTPAVAAIRKEIKAHHWRTERSNPAAKLSVTLHDLHRRLAQFAVAPIKPTAAAATQAAQKMAAVPASERVAVRHYLDKLRRLDGQVRAQFAATYAHLKHHHLPTAILQREQVAQKKYHVRMAALMQTLKTASQAPNATTFHANLVAASEQLDRHLVKLPHEKFDPRHLPFAVAKNRHIKPRLTRRAYARHPVIQGKTAPMARSASVTTQQATPATNVPANPNDPSYLAPTVDVQLTATIKAKAAALDHNPVKIFNWVHNHIEYIPTYGSIQGAAQTLATLRGNDFDTASLLIALLRASGIPARYVYGTIRVPIGEVENWVGGVTDPNAALNLLGQGGIPATGLVQGGQIKYVRLEHVWVEAWINYLPARGSKSGPGNTWVPLDASFKQYTYTKGLDPQTTVPFDMSSFEQNIMSMATVNEDEGWVSGIDASAVQQAVDNHENQIATFVNNHPTPLTTADLFGKKDIIQRGQGYLAAGLPYAVLAIGSRMAALTSSLRWKFTVQLQDAYGTQLLTYTVPTPEIATSRLAIGSVASTPSDAQVIASYVPTASSGGKISLSQFPTSLPGYLIHVTPQVLVNGQPVARGQSEALGTTLTTVEGYISPIASSTRTTSGIYTAGEYYAIGLDLQGTSPAAVSSLAIKLKNIQKDIQAGDYSAISAYDPSDTLTRAAIVEYFGINDIEDYVSQRSTGVVEYRLPSYGMFETTLSPVFSFGIPVSVDLQGFTMDVPLYHDTGVALDNDHQKIVDYILSTGARLSANEYLVPQQLFSTPDSPAEAVSAVKALSIADKQGQKIYTITSANISSTLGLLTVGEDVKVDIENAVNAGKIVTVSQSLIDYQGFHGVGYIVQDPQTGAAAWKISTGANGGFLKAYPGGMISGVLFVASIIVMLGAAYIALPLLAAIIVILTIINTVITTLQIDMELRENDCPPAMSYLLWGTSSIMVLLPVKFNSLELNLVTSFYAFMAPGAIEGSAPACKALTNNG